MTFEGALITKQETTFAVVIVEESILDSNEIENVRESYSPFFPGVPIILMAQNSRGTPIYHGREDIVEFLAGINHLRLPWEEYTIS